tara:strand:- start:4 stop:672 length:669 start_codon:yes stop_codon:yes gene_type:complete
MTIDRFFANDPSVLIHRDYITHLWPNDKMTTTQNLNAIVRLLVLLTLLQILLFGFKYSFVLSTLFSVILLVAYHHFMVLDKEVEPFDGFNEKKKVKKKVSFDKIKDTNPMGNVLVTDYNGNPNKKSAPPAYKPNVVEEINKQTKSFIKNFNSDNNQIDKKLFRDLGDNYMFEDSMSRFYSNPNTQVPNDQEGFAKFCYGDMVSTKEGNKFAAARHNPRYTNY